MLILDGKNILANIVSRLGFSVGRGMKKVQEFFSKSAGNFNSSILLHLKPKKVCYDNLRHKIKERYIQKFIKE